MSEENTPEKLEVPTTQEEKPEADAPTAESDTPSVEVPDLDYGYVVGVKPDGQFHFEALGSNQGLVQLLGVHKYAEHRLSVATDINQQYGFPVLAQQVHQLTEMMKVLLNVIGNQTQAQNQGDRRIVTP